MISEIIDNLCITFRSSGENADAQIHDSEEALLDLSTNIEFYPSLFEIISSDEIPNEIRKAALIYLHFLIKEWSNTLSEEAQIFIIENFPLLLENSYQFLSLYIKISASLVGCTFFSGQNSEEIDLWPNLLEVISIGFSNFESEKEKTFSSIILLNSISRRYKRRSDIEPAPIIDDFYPFLREFIIFSIDSIICESKEENEANNNYLPYVSICYQTINFFNWSKLSQYFVENVDNFNELLLQTTTIASFDRLKCSEDEFVYFSKKVMNFSAKMIHMYPQFIKETVAIEIYRSLFEYFTKFRNNELVLKSVARLINSFLFYDETYQFILENGCSNFIIKLIFPFFYLSPQDVEDSGNDPSQFLAKFQTKDFVFDIESRAFLYQSLTQKTAELFENTESQEFPQFCVTVIQIFTKVVESYLNQESQHAEKDDALVYSILFLFSSIYPSIPYLNEESFNQLITFLSQLFESSSHLVLSGVLICINSISTSFSLKCSYLSSGLFPLEFYTCVSNLLISHPSQLVRYYSASTFCEIINYVYRFDRSNESAEIDQQLKSILESCSQFLPEILNSYFELSSEFNDFELVDFSITVMTIFSSLLINDASQLICQVFDIFLKHQDLAQSSKPQISHFGNQIIDSLFQFIKEIFERSSEISDDLIICPLLENIYQLLNSSDLFHVQTYKSIFELVAKISFVSTFNFSSIENRNGLSKNLEGEPIIPSLYAIQVVKRDENENFSSLFWKIYEVIPQIIETVDFELVEDGIYAMRSIFICNYESGLTEEILGFTLDLLCEKYLIQFSNVLSDQIYATMLFLSTVFITAPPNSISNIDEIYKNLIELLKHFFTKYEAWFYSQILFISMVIQNSTTFFQILNEMSSLFEEEEEEFEGQSGDENEEDKNEFGGLNLNFVETFCMRWINISDCFYQMLFVVNFHQSFSDEVNCVFIKKTLKNFRRNYNSFDFSSSDQKIDLFFSPSFSNNENPCSLLFLDSNIILDHFTQFMQSISESIPDLFGEFNEIIQIRNYYFNDEIENEINFDDDDETDL